MKLKWRQMPNNGGGLIPNGNQSCIIIKNVHDPNGWMTIAVALALFFKIEDFCSSV